MLLLIDAGATGEADPWGLGVRVGEVQRYIFVAIGGGRTVAILLDDTSTPSRFADLVAQAMPIVATFTFPR